MNRVPRWLFPVALTGFLACVDVVLVEERPAAELAVEMEASVSSQAKVFYDTGAGFNEREAATYPVLDSKSHLLSFPLPAKAVRAIRFDPLEIGGVVRIRRLAIQKPGTHRQLRQLDVSKIIPLNEIQAATPTPLGLELKIGDDARDPQLLLPVTRPLRIPHSTEDFLTRRNLATAGFFLLLVLGTVVVSKWWDRFSRPLHAINAVFDRWTSRANASSFLPLDRAALWFYSLCLLGFVLFSAGKFHGSSISVASATYRGWIDVEHTPLLGTPKSVRSDEWSFQTATILNQLYRPDRLSVNDTLVGPGKAALLGNIPCWHFSQLFRPQFWSFFVLPPEFAFAIYWQCKALLLLTGVFTLALLLTRSSLVAALCALWYFFSAYTQWGYSWASLLPEMVGLFGWTVSLTCYLMVGRNRLGLTLAAIACAGCAINFALCAYPPHQLPLALFGAAIVAGWIWHNWRTIRARPYLTTRLLCLVSCWLLLVGGVLAWIYFDARDTILAAASTVYPGQRSSSGGGIAPAQFLSHFLDFWNSEENFPPLQGNVCEASGYLWLAPFTLFLPRAPKGHRRFTPLLICSWVAFLLLLAWMLLPIPAEAARWILFNRAPPFRCYHALGLINIVIVGMFLAEHATAGEHRRSRAIGYLRGFAAIILFIWLLVWMNRNLGHFFSESAIVLASVYVLVLVFLLVRARPVAFAAVLLIPLILANGLINPIDRGLEVITHSSLFKAAHGNHKEWLNGKWLIYSPWADQPTFLAGTGIDVIDCLKIVPDRRRMAVFDPDSRYTQVINRSCYLFASPLSSGQPAAFEAPIMATVVWRVNPLDPRLKQIGVDRVAFAYQPPIAEFNKQVALYLEAALPGLQVYRLP